MQADTPDLLARFKAGDEGAYQVLLDRYGAGLARFVRAHLTGPLAAHVQVEDVLQETHLSALRALDSFHHRTELSFFLWLCAIARNVLRMHARKLGRTPPRARLAGDSSSRDILQTLVAATPTPGSRMVAQERVQALAVALSRLPPRRRQAILLRHLDEMDNDEAARAMGMSVGAFRVLVSRALVDLREAIDAIAPEPSA